MPLALEVVLQNAAYISPEELNALIGTPHCPLIVDVRREAVFTAAPNRIAGAIWHDHMSIEQLAPQMTDGEAIVYCAHGHNVSQIAATRLRAAGIQARVLSGGIAAFEEALGLIVSQGKTLPSGLASKPSVWVTRERPKIDRIACPWLIRRFVDPFAEFHFVAAEWVKDVADEMNGIPFDIDEVFWSHRGEACTFDTMIAEFGLASPALAAVANIVRGADTARPELAPQSAGLLVISLGLSRIFDRDLEQLEAGLQVYDALYAWARDGQDESHKWPSSQKAAS
jgi:rhodanese-related sulfurtransferase